MSFEQLEACEMLTTGECPFKCIYCYIPKTSAMRATHAKIAGKIKSGEFLENVKKVFGDKLGHLSFWGTEPTLTLPLLEEKIPDILKMFPNLESMGFSTAGMANPTIIYNFLKTLQKHIKFDKNKKIEFEIQISVDGPSKITDENRIKGASRIIPKNFYKLIEMLNYLHLTNLVVTFRWKPTISLENMDVLMEGTNLAEYAVYFETLNKNFEALNKNPKVSLSGGSFDPTLVVPGKYTSEDGKKFAKFLRFLHERGQGTTYDNRFERMFEWAHEAYKKRMFTCSGGDGNLGVGDSVHICHRTFYYDYDNYVDSVFDEKDMENWDVSLFKRGTLAHIRKSYIVDPNDKFELARFLYIMRGFHDYWRLSVQQIFALVKELALVGQADKKYLEDDHLAQLFATFLVIGFNCPMENVLNTGTLHYTPLSIIRLMANGAFQELIGRLRWLESRARK